MAKKIILFGAGDIAEVAHFYFTHDSDYEVAAFCVDKDYITATEKFGLPVVAFEEVETLYPPHEYDAFVALSYSKMNSIRRQKYDAMQDKGYTLISYVSSKASTFPDFTCGENCFILEDNTIQPFVTIGNNVTLWSGNHIGHHSTIGDDVFISSHVVVSGGVVIKDGCFLGVNATLHDHITIGKKTAILAGATIAKDTPDESVWRGQPSDMVKIPSTKLKGL